MKYMETTTWEVCSFIGVLLQKAECFSDCCRQAGARRTGFIGVAYTKKQSAFCVLRVLEQIVILAFLVV